MQFAGFVGVGLTGLPECLSLCFYEIAPPVQEAPEKLSEDRKSDCSSEDIRQFPNLLPDVGGLCGENGRRQSGLQRGLPLLRQLG